MKNLSEKVILVTGASKGIGAAIAKRLAEAGAKVIVNYAGSKAAAEDVVNNIKENGGEAIAVQADVSKADQVKDLFDQSIQEFGRIDVLVNNAGIMITKPLKDTTDEDFTRQFDINVRGVFNTLREASAKLADNGSIINFSTTVNRLMLPTYGTYVATKSAVEQLTRVFSKEVGRGINVNSVSPGPTNTELFVNGKPQQVIDHLASLNPFGRIGEPSDIAEIVVFLASDQAKWVNAQNIGVNGGMA
ncbi:SDR family oxidoreductase [Flavobacterium daejeonense]|uniref:SDR family oxidoreductase n=1 Tax=Flavobacterium daejeonense TaxID=350893 RepID=UPI00047E10C1|nr:SDR family oxidoreductase [Flavobacterium daejeonense]